MGPAGPSAALSSITRKGDTHHALGQMNVTMRSSKEEIATAAVELIDTQAEQLAAMQQQQVILWALVGLLATLLVF